MLEERINGSARLAGSHSAVVVVNYTEQTDAESRVS